MFYLLIVDNVLNKMRQGYFTRDRLLYVLVYTLTLKRKTTNFQLKKFCFINDGNIQIFDDHLS